MSVYTATLSHLDELEARVVKALAQPGPGRLIAPDPLRGTVHMAAADAAGNVVAWTQTHGGGFGSGVMVSVKTPFLSGVFKAMPRRVGLIRPGTSSLSVSACTVKSSPPVSM